MGGNGTGPILLVGGNGTGPILLSQATFLLAHIANSGPVPLPNTPLSRFPIQNDIASFVGWSQSLISLGF